MKIGIDGALLSLKYPCGTKHYAEQLISALAKEDKKNIYIIFSKENIKVPRARNFHLKRIPRWLPFFKRQFFLSFLARQEKVDVFHFLGQAGSLFLKNIKVITTVHDIDLNQIYSRLKNPFFLYEKAYVDFIRQYTFKNTSHFISNSDFTKRQLRSYLKRTKVESPITTIPLAPSQRFKVLGHAKNPRKEFFLCMGDFSPRKNVLGVIESYSILPMELRNKYDLKIIISHNAPSQEFLKKAASLEIKSNIKFINSPSLSKLVGLYNQAAIFLYPSLYEGFGLPILEAMACGCPVITSNLGATKETAGNAAFLVNPESSIAIADAVVKITKNPRLKKGLIFKGIERVKKFSWEKVARETLNVYKLAQ